MKTYSSILILAVILLTACNKTNRFSNRLAGETWKITSITVGGEAEEAEHLAELQFEDCDIYDETCMGEWMLEGEHAEFAWQFNENGDKFTLSNQSEAEHDHDHDHEGDDHDHDHEGDDHDHDHGHEHEADAVTQCQEFSGTYDVDEMKRNTMIIKSTETIGHPGEEVVIELEKS